MIADRIENAALYSSVSPRLARALQSLRGDIVHLPDGRHDIEGDAMFCIVQRYISRTSDQCNLEAHRKYIDVQLIVSGEEAIRWVNPDGLAVRAPYDAAQDKVFFDPAEPMSTLTLRAGMFAIFFPQDAHQPCMQVSGPSQVHKAVIKVLIE